MELDAWCGVKCDSCHRDSGPNAEPGDPDSALNPPSSGWRSAAQSCTRCRVSGGQQQPQRHDRRLSGLAAYLWGSFTPDFDRMPSERFAMHMNFTRECCQSTANLISKAKRVNYSIPNPFPGDINDFIDSLGAGFDASLFDNCLGWRAGYAFALSGMARDLPSVPHRRVGHSECHRLRAARHLGEVP